MVTPLCQLVGFVQRGLLPVAAPLAIASLMLAALGCAATSAGTVAGAGGQAAQGGSGGEGGEGAQGGAGGNAGSFPGGAGGAGGTACSTIKKDANIKPLNLNVLLDKSTSMDGFKWTAAEQALSAFWSDPASAGTKGALTVFPRDPDGTPLCDQIPYKSPLVDFTPLPAGAPALEAALGLEAPDGFSSPMYPALGGALLRGLELVADGTEAAAVLLVTDGKPQGPAASCSGVNPEDPAQIAAIAQAAALMNPPVLTFVIGLPGVDQGIANQIAAAGGTGQAVVVSSANVAAELQAALAKAKGEALPCEYELPPEALSEFGLEFVNVVVTSSVGVETTLPFDDGCAAGEGWTYGGGNPPTEIVLCGAACANTKSDLGASIDIALGCPTLVSN